jgi:hypothetical protein
VVGPPAPPAGAASFLTETISRVRNAGATGQLTVRADSAFYAKAFLSTAAKFDVRFSVTARQDKRVRAAIDAIDPSAWQPIPYWLSTPEVSGADVAETAFTVFAGDQRHARTVRLVVRRVRPTPGSQLALFTTWDYHAFVTDRDRTSEDHEHTSGGKGALTCENADEPSGSRVTTARLHTSPASGSTA